LTDSNIHSGKKFTLVESFVFLALWFQ